MIAGSFGWSLAGIWKHDNKDNYFNTGGFICFLVAGNVNNANLYFKSFQLALCLVVRAHRGVYILVKHSLFASVTKTDARRIICRIYLLLCDLNMSLHRRGITRRTTNVFPSSYRRIMRSLVWRRPIESFSTDDEHEYEYEFSSFSQLYS